MRGSVKIPAKGIIHFNNPYSLYSPNDRPKISKAGKGKVKVMLPVLEGEEVSWEEVEVERTLWKCNECGRVWPTRWQAVLCRINGHRDWFEVVYSYRDRTYEKKFPCVKKPIKEEVK